MLENFKKNNERSPQSLVRYEDVQRIIYIIETEFGVEVE